MAHGAERYEFGSGNYLNVEVGMRNAEKKKSKGQRAWRMGLGDWLVGLVELNKLP